MILNDGLSIKDFTYKREEYLRYKKASEALHKYRKKLEKQKDKRDCNKAKRIRLQSEITYKLSDFLSDVCPIILFMIIEMSLVIKGLGLDSMVVPEFQEIQKYFDIINTIGLLSIIIVVIWAIVKLKRASIMKVLKQIIGKAFKAVLVWLLLFCIIYVIGLYASQGSTVEKFLKEII